MVFPFAVGGVACAVPTICGFTAGFALRFGHVRLDQLHSTAPRCCWLLMSVVPAGTANLFVGSLCERATIDPDYY
jgi:hypothetical protein